MRLGDVIAASVKDGTKAFVPFITAGDPDAGTTVALLRALGEAGATAIELGIPFSDPVGDGITIQRAAERALQRGVTTESVLAMVRAARDAGVTTPIVLFSYINPIARMGYAEFARRAAEAGADGVLVVDLPAEEAAEHRAAMAAHGIDTVFLASPTTTADRLRLASEASTGFVYYVSRTGVTGVRSSLSETLGAELARVREHVARPVLVGFGITTAEQAASVAAVADGVVVGSALVDVIASAPSPDEAVARAAELVRTMVAAVVPVA